MALPDLTGQNIENTYQRVLHTDGTLIWDGTGSLVTLQYTGSFSGDGSGLTGIISSPAQPTNSIQFNNNGVLGGTSSFVFNVNTSIVQLTGSLLVSGSVDGVINGGFF
jgi:hypothetical protein